MIKRTLTSITLVLLIIITGAGAFLLFKAAFTPAEQSNAVRPLHDSVPRSEAVPFSTHRALSMAPNQAATALMPWGIALDKVHGFTWVAEPGCEPKPKCPTNIQGMIGQYALSDGNLIQSISLPAGYSSPLFLALDAIGDVWFTEPTTDAIGVYNPQDGTWNQWSLKKGSSPYDLVFDTQGNLWFTEFGSNKIGFLNLSTHQVIETPTPTANSNPYGITITPQGTIWFTENAINVDQIASFTPTSSGTIKITEHAVNGIRPHLIASDRAGNLWYSGGFGGDIGEFSPRSGQDTTFAAFHGTCPSPTNCTGTHISGIYVDSAGNVWFTDSLNQRVGYVVPSSGRIVTRTLQNSNAHPYDGLIIDSSDRVWFTSEFERTITVWPVGTV
jgi:virginiamycin B lyase